MHERDDFSVSRGDRSWFSVSVLHRAQAIDSFWGAIAA